MPGMSTSFLRLASMVETSKARASFKSIGRVLDSTYFPRRIESQIGSSVILGWIRFKLERQACRSSERRSCREVPLGLSGIP
jgi:hypothetical protein